MNPELDLVLVNPFVLVERRERLRKMEPYPPLGLAALAAWVRQRGYRVAIVDGTFHPSLGGLIRELDGTRSKVAGVYAMNGFRSQALAVVRSLAASGRTVLCGGPDPAVYPEVYLRAGARVAARSEGEATLTDLLAHFLKNEGALHEIAGITYISGGDLVTTVP
ncbi:MAG: cobalamin-dependent protein [Acidobacteriota bacterium]